jgi:hypothetical protein
MFYSFGILHRSGYGKSAGAKMNKDSFFSLTSVLLPVVVFL